MERTLQVPVLSCSGAAVRRVSGMLPLQTSRVSRMRVVSGTGIVQPACVVGAGRSVGAESLVRVCECVFPGGSACVRECMCECVSVFECVVEEVGCVLPKDAQRKQEDLGAE